MTVTLEMGMRRYVLLIPYSVQTPEGVFRVDAFHIKPVTYRIERDWQDGLIDGRLGMLEALIARLVVEPYFLIEEMRHPDVAMFRQEFALHLPQSISGSIARGEYPTAAVPADDLRHSTFDIDVTGLDPEPDDPPPAPRPGPDIRPSPNTSQPSAPSFDDDPNAALAALGPDESLGTLAQQEEAARAREARTNPSDPLAEARALVMEPPTPDPAASASQANLARPGGNPQDVPSPRNPFTESTAVPLRNNRVIRPPTVPRAAAAAAAQRAGETTTGFVRRSAPTPPGIDPRTGREAIFDPKADYVPDMAGESAPMPGVDPAPVEARGLGAPYGIDDIE